MNKLSKSNRKQDKEVLESFYEKSCLVCGKFGCDPAHIKTKGSGGDDEKNNLMPLCRIHHIEQHKIGIVTFIKKYQSVYSYVERLGYQINSYNKLVKS